ncbi:MAG: hypothetical protein ACI8W8_003068 [Rhodothermales bacterium]|jgi:hypothetical protein
MKTLSLLSCFFFLLVCAAAPKKGPFAPVTDNPDLPRVLIIGDSISIGYTLATRALLADSANVHRVPTNAGHTGMGINGLPKWLDASKGTWDVIHFNWGLWDLCYRNPKSKTQGNRDKLHGTITHSPEIYAKNLERIVAELKKTGAKLIFATTTPVPEGELGRKLGDDVRYNAVAQKIMAAHGIAVNDLHAVMAERMAEFGKKAGDVHFTPAGYELLGQHVAKAIAAALSPQTLFDGSDFSAWELDQAEGWMIDDGGAMVCRVTQGKDKKGKLRMRGMGDIWSKAEYANFELSLSYKLTEGANSGVFYRSDKSNPVQGVFEVQLMDNVGFQKSHGIKDARKLNGSFYDGKAPSSDPSNPVGEWNGFRLTCDGPSIRIGINGIEIISVNVDDWDTPGKNPDGTTNKFKTALKDLPRRGRIGFQNHGQIVSFKNVRIRPLP